jgi:hypothetical protein
MFGDLGLPPEVFDFGGKIAGVGLLLVALILFTQGYRRLFFLVGGVGGLIGYVVGGLVAPFASDYVGETELIIGATVLFFLLAFQISKTMIRLMGSMIVFLAMLMILRVVTTIFGIDLERDYGDFGAGLIAIIAFFSRLDIREKLPMLMSAVLSSACIVAGIHFIGGGIVSGIDFTDPRSSSFVVVLTILSMEVQNRDLIRWSENKLKVEVEKELVKKGVIKKKPLLQRLFNTDPWKKETGMPPDDRKSLEKLQAKHSKSDPTKVSQKEAITRFKHHRGRS